MNRLLTVAVVVTAFSAGCQTPCKPTKEFTRLPDSADPWNTNYLIDLDVTQTSVADLASYANTVEEHYWKYAQVEGVVWPPWRSDPGLEHPDRWTDGGDGGIFTGSALAGWCFKYGTTRKAEDLEAVEKTLKGVWILTHAAGKGVLCRNAAPANIGERFGYPDEVQHRKQFIGQGPVLTDPFTNAPIPGGGFWYYTRGTKDQLTGIVFGLSAAWAICNPDTAPPALKARCEKIRGVVMTCTADVLEHLLKHDWRIRDAKGENDTSADYVSGLLKVAVLGLVKVTGAGDATTYWSQFDKAMDMRNTLAYVDRIANYDAYYGHNLRTTRLLGLWLLESDPTRRAALAEYMELNVWAFTKGHRNAFFCFARNAMHPDSPDRISDGVRGLQGLANRPLRMWSSPYAGQVRFPDLVSVIANCTEAWVIDVHLRKPSDYWSWQKAPWDTNKYAFPPPGFNTTAQGSLVGADYITAYWLGKLFNLF